MHLVIHIGPIQSRLRWRVTWLAEIVGLDSEEIRFFLQLSEMTIRGYVKKFRDFGEVSTAIIHHIIAFLRNCGREVF